MEFKLIHTKQVSQNPVGVFVEDSNMMTWIETASQLGLNEVKFFPVPGNEANSVCGAILLSAEINADSSTRFPKIYKLGAAFYVLSNSQISPKLGESALTERFASTPHFFHPVYGLMELSEFKDWSAHIDLKPNTINTVKPQEGPEFPNRLGEYFIREIEPEEVLRNLIKKSVPNRKSLDSKPLSTWDKVKMRAFRTILGKKKGAGKEDKDAESESQSQPASGEEVNAHEIKKKSWWKRRKEEMNTQLEDLEERNKKELDKLMDMLKNNPDEALKYALPIDRSGHTRGPEVGFTMQKRWSRGASIGSGSGGSVNIGDSKADILRKQYLEMAEQYRQNQDWEKASFVYMELLSDPSSAADVLKQGKKYDAAAAIYLTKCKQKPNAAECYELGKFYGRAIDLYEELDRHEKVGDLYTKMGNESKAKSAYHKEIEQLYKSDRFFDAGELSKTKLAEIEEARLHYMNGWNSDKRPNDCLNEYLNTYDLKEKRESIKHLHGEELDGKHAHRFLEVLKTQLTQNAELQQDIELVAYETIARNSSRDKTIVNLLSTFNQSELVSKDMMRFKHGRR